VGAHRADSSVGDRDRALDSMRCVSRIWPFRRPEILGIFFASQRMQRTNSIEIVFFARAAAKKIGW
jgi:hypothetical protein